MGPNSRQVMTAQKQMAAELRDAGLDLIEIAARICWQWPQASPLAALRIAKGWTQERAAEEWNLTWGGNKTGANIGNWEHGRKGPSRRTLDRLAGLYGCTVTSPFFTTDNTSRHLSTDTPDRKPEPVGHDRKPGWPDPRPATSFSDTESSHCPGCRCPSEGTDPVERRTFIATTTAAAASTLFDVSSGGFGPVLRTLFDSPSLPVSKQALDLTALAAETRTAEHLWDKGRVAARMERLLSLVDKLDAHAETASDKDRRQVFELEALTYRNLSDLILNRGEPQLAAEAAHRAIEAAANAESPLVQGLTRFTTAKVLANIGDHSQTIAPIDRVVDSVIDDRSRFHSITGTPGSPHLSHALATNMFQRTAFAEARAGNHDHALGLLADAGTAGTEVDAPIDLWCFTHSPDKASLLEAEVHQQLGNHETALTLIDRTDPETLRPFLRFDLLMAGARSHIDLSNQGHAIDLLGRAATLTPGLFATRPEIGQLLDTLEQQANTGARNKIHDLRQRRSSTAGVSGDPA